MNFPEPYQFRVLQETLDLEDKIFKLSAYLDKMSTKDGLLEQQLVAMKQYAAILHARIKGF